MTVDLAGRVAVVTGANRGIGFAVCRALGREGAKVVLGARDEAAGKKAAAELQSDGLDVVYRQLDVTNQVSIEALAAWLNSEYGRLDVLVNNAAILPSRRNVLDVPLSEVEETLQVNLLGAWRMTQALAPLMQRNGWGRIVNVSSESASLERMAVATSVSYRVSKTALNALTRTLAPLVRGDGILVNAVDPGWVHTEMGGAGAPRTPEEGAESIMWAVRIDDDGPSGGYFQDGKPMPW
jgi:NAD(P)-dependent dehydrogenase (short-subunit alcohol dehydrogenase family)